MNLLSIPVIPKFRNLFNFFAFDKQKQLLTVTDLQSFQKVFNEQLNMFLEEKISVFRSITNAKVPVQTLEHAVSIVRDGGKRVRPYICFLTYCTENGGDQRGALYTSMALELFHAFALIHDDVIDGGKERHGKATTHTYIEGVIDTLPRGNKKHIAEGLAILSGDLFFSWSSEIMAKAQNAEANKIFLRMIDEVVAGQMLDVSLMLESKTTSETLRCKNELKTALYSFVNPMLIGAALAYTHDRTELYRSLGLLLGQAFQIQDDLLDITGSHEKTGKLPFIDIQDGQHTLLTQYIFEKGKPEDIEILMAFFGRPLDDHARKILSRLFNSTGAISYGEKEAARLINEAEYLITHSDFTSQDIKKWMDFIGLLKKRTA